MRTVLIGADGGGTKTNWVAVETKTGQVIATATAGSIHTLTFDQATVTERLCQGIGGLQLAESDRIVGIGLGDPAIDDTANGQKAGQWLRNHISEQYGCPCFSKSDLFMALYAFTEGKSGAFLAAGTGSMGIALPNPYVHGEENAVITVGGWGDPTCDPGSGCDIAVQGICAAIRAFDGVGPQTTLCDALLSFFAVNQPRDLIGHLNNPNVTRSSLASFARQVAECARLGDEVAVSVLQRAGEVLAAYAIRLLQEIPTAQFGVYGSILTKNCTVRETFELVLKKRFSHVDVRIPQHAPEYGAAMFAADALMIDRSEWK
ncbi:MAG: hypothetical protein IKT68_05400 [Clostridia bacterium]|nr:hypothetical protein [Clostridia bacterium]